MKKDAKVTYDAATVARRFGVSRELAAAHLRRNAAGMRQMAERCIAAYFAGKRKYSGYPATPAVATWFMAKAANYEQAANA